MLCKILDYKTEKNYNVSFSCLALVAWFYWSSVQNASIINDENSNFMWTVFKLLDQNYVTRHETMMYWKELRINALLKLVLLECM